MEDEEIRSIAELQADMYWDEDEIPTLPDEDDCEFQDRQYGREY